MKKLLFINNAQFGYHTDSYIYCLYLGRDNDVTYLCWDYGLERVEAENVKVIYVLRSGNKIQRLSRFIHHAIEKMNADRSTIAFIVYFRLCSILKWFGKCEHIILDIRTGYVLKSRIRGMLHNLGIRFESMFFDRVTIITEELRQMLRIPAYKSHILPLGAETTEFSDKDFSEMRLIYVGTFNNREIAKTIEGFDRFVSAQNGSIRSQYDIIGFGMPDEEQRIHDAIGRSANKDRIKFHGRIPHKRLHPYLSASNIGVAFVPIVSYQQPQPYTKVFEYLLAGMPVLATANNSNKKVIDDTNGVLVQDTAADFQRGLDVMITRMRTYNSTMIKQDARKYSWAEIIDTNLRPYFASLPSGGSRG